jgi:intracellular sulfur oxidation DsrE/DsrF family protein
MEIVMKTWLIIVAAIATFAGSLNFASAQSLPVPGVDAARDVRGAMELPDPELLHKVVFDVATGASDVGDVNPWLNVIAEYVNTLAKHGVPADKREIAVVFHQGSTPAILNNEAYRARNNGADNPNIALIKSLDNAGVEFHVCGQAVLGREIDPATILPEIQLDLWALTTIVDMQLRGYVLVGG